MITFEELDSTALKIQSADILNLIGQSEEAHAAAFLKETFELENEQALLAFYLLGMLAGVEAVEARTLEVPKSAEERLDPQYGQRGPE